jgi:hypothetical protein
MEYHKMTKPTIRIHNIETDEVIDREMTNAEFAQYEAEQAEQAAKQAEAEAKAQAKIAAEGKLAALGLTTDDLRALGL